MAKKILAVVLAVMVALSAMAISAFADTQIPLFNADDYATKATTATISMTIPVYPQYGWAVQYDAIDLVLPTNLGAAMSGVEIDWNVVVNGNTYAIQPLLAKGDPDVASNGNEANGDWGNNVAGTYTQRIHFGAFTHGFIDTTQWTTVPQPGAYGTLNSITITAEIELSDSSNYAEWMFGSGFANINSYGVDVGFSSKDAFLKAVYGGLCYAQYMTLDDTGAYVEVPNSRSYLQDWTISFAAENVNDQIGIMQFVSGDLTKSLTVASQGNGSWSETVAAPLTWDHTLANRALLSGADKLELVVELNKPIVGIATYSLYARNTDTGWYGYDQNTWWNYEAARVYVGSVTVNGTDTTELRFDVPVSTIFGTAYGDYNDEFVIFETIGLKNEVYMFDHHTAKTQAEGGAADSNGASVGVAGSLAWGNNNGTGWNDKKDPTTGRSWVFYNGAPINYAAGGAEFAHPNDGGANALYSQAVFATNVYLNIVEDEEEPEEVENPVEPGETDEEEENVEDGDDINVGDEEPETTAPVDANPGTGVALAVIPMLVAAAAAVVSKKH